MEMALRLFTRKPPQRHYLRQRYFKSRSPCLAA